MSRCTTSIDALAFLAALMACAQVSHACKYNVRDVGFADTGARPYALRLRLPTGADRPAMLAAAVEAFADSNVRPELLDATDDSAFTATLVHPDGRELPLALDATGPDGLRRSLDAAVRSPLRDALRPMLLERHSVVIVIHGSDDAANRAADRAAADSVSTIEHAMAGLPKPIGRGPAVITLTLADQRTERVLLWSLNVESSGEAANMVVLFGRMRTLGPALTVPPVDAATLTARMGYVGADCECELDRSWMTGDMLPHVWTPDAESAAAASLGFDPGSPLVISEIRQILDRGPSNTRRLDRIGVVRSVDPLLGYTETEITPTTPPADSAATATAVSLDPAKHASTFEILDGKRESRPIWPWVVLGSVIGACVIGGTLILVTSRRQV